MTPSPSNLTELAKQGDPQAIEALINRSLQPKGITAKVTALRNDLQIRLESAQVPNQMALTKFVYKGVSNLEIASVRTVRLSGYLLGEAAPAWEEDLEMPMLSSTVLPPISSTVPPMMADSDQDVDSQGDMAESEDEQFLEQSLEKPRQLGGLGQNQRLLIPGAIVLLLGLSALVYFLFFKPKDIPVVAVDPTVPATADPSPAAETSPDATAPAATTSPEASPTVEASIPAPEASPTASIEPTASPEPTVSPEPTPSTESTASPEVSTAPFRDAVNKAMEAAESTQTATTVVEWQQVVNLWLESIDLLKQVPSEDTNYAIAQQKIVEYQRNREYAQQRADSAAP